MHIVRQFIFQQWHECCHVVDHIQSRCTLGRGCFARTLERSGITQGVPIAQVETPDKGYLFHYYIRGIRWEKRDITWSGKVIIFGSSFVALLTFRMVITISPWCKNVLYLLLNWSTKCLHLWCTNYGTWKEC